MSYCRWENTLAALQECQDSITDGLSETEAVSRIDVIVTAAEMLERIGVSVDTSDLLAAIARLGVCRG